MSRLNSENFIEKAKEIHGDKYLYDKAIYINSNKKVEIICPIHGSFWIRPNDHIHKKSGCSKCSYIKRGLDQTLTQNDFLDRCIENHGDKYDYSKSIYINMKTPVLISCPIHGEFKQKPMIHLNGGECPRCSKVKLGDSMSYSQEEFIKKCSKIHNNKYDYSLVKYNRSTDLVTIICPEHGKFTQKAAFHLAGKGCKKCGILSASSKTSLGKNTFVSKAKIIHGDKYIYDDVIYVNSKDNVKVICKEHGPYLTIPNSHLRGSGCPKCGRIQAAISKTFTNEEFIKRAKEIHNDKYDYSLVKYINWRKKVTIICPKHGEFTQSPNSHLSGSGCPKCILKSQMMLFEKLTSIFKNECFSWEYKTSWLGKLRIDICIEKHKIAIEYDGEQHFHPINHFGGEAKFKKLIKNDALKERLCEENGFKLFRIKYNYTDEDFYNLCVEIQKIIDNGEN